MRWVHERLLRGLVGMLESELAVDEDRRRQAALAIAALCVGGMAPARAIDDQALRDELLRAAHLTAVSVDSIDAALAAAK